jgi:predicted DNA binding protein
MTLVGEFNIPRDRFVLSDTLTELPKLRLEILRVVATKMVVSPLILLTPTESTAPVDETIRDDESIKNVQHLSTFETGALYRAEWDQRVESGAKTFTTDRGDILSASAGPPGWRLTAQFADREAFDTFLGHLREDDIEFSLHRLNEAEFPPKRLQYGLTPKQYEALLTAWRMGYYKMPQETSLDAVADKLGVSQQAVSQRLARAEDSLIGETVGTHSSE